MTMSQNINHMMLNQQCWVMLTLKKGMSIKKLTDCVIFGRKYHIFKIFITVQILEILRKFWNSRWINSKGGFYRTFSQLGNFLPKMTFHLFQRVNFEKNNEPISEAKIEKNRNYLNWEKCFSRDFDLLIVEIFESKIIFAIFLGRWCGRIRDFTVTNDLGFLSALLKNCESK